MSLAIDVDAVTAVLLADGWHEVADDSFSLDAYEFIWSGKGGVRAADMNGDRDPMVLHGGGGSGVCATGYEFIDDGGEVIAGPLTAILAVRRARVPEDD